MSDSQQNNMSLQNSETDKLFSKKQLLLWAGIFIVCPLLIGIAFRPNPVSIEHKRKGFDRSSISKWIYSKQRAPNIHQKLDVNLNNTLTIIGVNLPKEAVSRGQNSKISVFFRTEKEIERNWTIFGHVDAKGGKNRIHADHEPVSGHYPTSLWQKGEIIEDQFSIDVANSSSPGNYDVFIGLYIGKERMKIIGSASKYAGENKILLGQIKVK